MNLENVTSIAITDCGSTTTKAILIEKIDGVFRQTYRGDSPTTVEAPVEDVTRGVVAAIDDMAAARGRRLVNDSADLIRPSSNGEGIDLFLSTSSAGGGLQMMVAGAVRRISAQSAQRAALGAGAIVADVLACDDVRPVHEQIERLRKLRPDMVLLAGGTDGGADLLVIEMAEILAAADPKPRFGHNFKLPVIFAGNKDIQDQISDTLGEQCELFITDNIRPEVETETLGPARERIHDLFLDHVMRQAPGFGRLVDWTDTAVMPTPSAVGAMLGKVAKKEDINVLCVDIGGATTDIFSVVDHAFTRTVSANLGMSYSATNVLAECGIHNVTRWLDFKMDESKLLDLVMNKTIRPTTIPDSVEELHIEQALAREALRLSFKQHQDFATGLKGARKGAGIDRGFASAQDETLIKPMKLNLLIGSGGVLSHAPTSQQTASMMIDSFLPEGVTRLAKDSIFMLPHLGVLSEILPDAAASVFERDCIKYLGTCVAPKGPAKTGKPCLEYKLQTGEQGTLKMGEYKTLKLGEDEQQRLELNPARGFDVGAGPGRPWTGTVHGGLVGLILDGRGRPSIQGEGDQ